jgi:hypothetical protein
MPVDPRLSVKTLALRRQSFFGCTSIPSNIKSFLKKVVVFWKPFCEILEVATFRESGMIVTTGPREPLFGKMK